MIAVRPPEYWPRLAYFALMECVDLFVIADTFQYSRQSYQNRTRIRNPQGWQWLSVPLESRQHGKPVREVLIDNKQHWPSRHVRGLRFNYNTTPYYIYREPAVESLLTQERVILADVTSASVYALKAWLGVETRTVLASSLPGMPASVEAIMEELGDTELLVPAEVAAIDGAFGRPGAVLTLESVPYEQNFEGYQGDMSALDAFFNHGPDARSLLLQAEIHPYAQWSSR